MEVHVAGSGALMVHEDIPPECITTVYAFSHAGGTTTRLPLYSTRVARQGSIQFVPPRGGEPFAVTIRGKQPGKGVGGSAPGGVVAGRESDPLFQMRCPACNRWVPCGLLEPV